MNNSYEAFCTWWDGTWIGHNPDEPDASKSPDSPHARKWDVIYDLWKKARNWDNVNGPCEPVTGEESPTTNPWVIIDERIEEVEQNIVALKQYFHNHSHTTPGRRLLLWLTSTSNLPRTPFDGDTHIEKE